VLNGQPGVSEETSDAVLAAAKQLNYRPNLNARNLKRGTSRTLGIVAEDLTVFNAPGIIDGIGVSCETRKYHYILGNLRFDKRFGHRTGFIKEKSELLEDMMDEMLSKQIDGILYIGCHSHVVAPLSEQKETRFVCAYCFSEDPTIPAVIYDDREAAHKATELLLSKGHRSIGVIAGPKDSYHTSNRLLGFQQALFDNDIPYNPRLTYYGDWERNQGFENAAPLIASGVTAIFAQNDLMALGVIDYCNDHGIQVGRDLALIGFDDRQIAAVCRPSLSTVSLPLFEIGRTAANVLLDMIENDTLPSSHEILLSCDIVERESTGGATLPTSSS
ncbi:MAG TPA: LacI family DNA-binding transcriptional regulator, partial [Spirochaetia bacterium]|nr:LacI family DNA-binding transcriptional regulator [Spirochaetia bacterium]